MARSDVPNSFLLMMTGQIESGYFPLLDEIYCRWTLVYGQDWRLTSGLEAGLTQLSRHSQLEGPSQGRFVLNQPIESTFTTSCPYGWPQLVLVCYGHDLRNNDLPRGYGAVHLPMAPASNVRRRVAMFVPRSSSLWQRLIGFVAGRRPEFVDQRIVAQSEGRDICRVATQGFVNVSFSIVVKDLKRMGYDCWPRGLQTLSEFPFKGAAVVDEEEDEQRTEAQSQSAGLQQPLPALPVEPPADEEVQRELHTLDETEEAAN